MHVIMCWFMSTIKDSKDTKYNGQKTKKQVLIEDLKKGFMPVDPQR